MKKNITKMKGPEPSTNIIKYKILTLNQESTLDRYFVYHFQNYKK